MNEWLFWVAGVLLGATLTLPLAWWWSVRTGRRVRGLEQRALRAERLAEMGTMTGGLAHEIKNPLSTIGLNAQLIQEDLAVVARDWADQPASEHLGRIHRRFSGLQREIGRLREILEDFLRFAGRVQLDRHPCSINQLVDELIDFFQPQAEAEDIRLRSQLAAAPDQVRVDVTLLKQALLNLMINAVQAMRDAREKKSPHGGANELIIQTANAGHREAREVLLQVTDTGPGLSEEAREKIFLPYFSTKRRGTGLGLPIARRIVEEHGGSLSVHSEPGRGSVFSIRLPAD